MTTVQEDDKNPVQNNGLNEAENNEPTAAEKAEQERQQGIKDALKAFLEPANVKRLRWKEGVRFSSTARWHR